MHATPEQVAQDIKVRDALKKIAHPILVMSGKGGVGKTTVSVNLAMELARRGFNVGIMDIDIHGPNVPKMLGIEDRALEGSDDGIIPVEVLPNLKAASLGLLGYDPDTAIIWRGPIKIGLIKQFLGDVAWGSLDYLIIDSPPGTGDENLTIAQAIPSLAGAVVVTTPQDVSILDSRKSVDFARKMKVPVLGIVENMSGFVCPCCQTLTPIFKTDGGRRAAENMEVPFLGAIPIEPALASAGDAGTPLVGGESLTAQALRDIVDRVLEQIKEYKAAGIYDSRTAPPGFRPER